MDGPLPNVATEVREYTPRVKGKDKQLLKEQQIQQQSNNESAAQTVETVMGVRYFLKSCRFVGIHMPKRNKIPYVVWSVIFNILATVYLPVGFFMSFTTLSGDDLQIGNLLTTLQAAINDLTLAIKIVSISFLLPKLLSCGPILNRLDTRCHTQEEIGIIKDCVNMGNRTVVLLYGCFYCYTISTFITGLIFHRLPYNIYNPLIDSKASNGNFYLAFVMETIIICMAVCQVIVSDSYPIIYVNIIRTHLNILCKRIENLNSSAAESLEANVYELKMCINDHQNILEIHNILAPIMSITIFVQFTVTAIILCVVLINILIFAAHFASTVASCFYVCAVVAEIFPLCYFCQCLMDESNRLQDVLFHSNWVGQNARYKKLLIFFMHRSQQTMEFTAGKLFPITLSNFLSIAKFSFSLYTFINQMGVKEKLAG